MEERSDEDIRCLSCSIRKELFDKSKLVFPRRFRKSIDERFEWPFKTIAPIDGDEVISNSPIKSAVMERIDAFERENVGVIVEYTENGSVIVPSGVKVNAKDPYAISPTRKKVSPFQLHPS